MSNIYAAMNTAKMALITHQTSLQIAGQNIANVNNPNFTRQEVQLESAFAVKSGPGLIGTGVRATGIVRRYDNFLEEQRLLNKASTGYWDANQDLMARLEVVFNESSEFGLNNQFDSFFQSWQELAFNPRGMTERTNVSAQGQTLADMYGKLNQDVKNLRVDMDTKIKSSITEINRLTTEIARYNTAIHEAETHGVHANDLRDQRDTSIRELADYVDIKTVEDSNNQTMVSIRGGRPLVIGQSSFTLSTTIRTDDPTTSGVFWDDGTGTTVEITGEMNSGKMGAWINMRDVDFPGYIDQLDLLAATMIRDVNNTHSGGFGLDGSTGTDFFSGLNVSATNSRNNTGTGAVTASIIAPDNVNLHKFRVTFNTAGATLTVHDLTRGVDVATQAGYVSGNNITYFQTNGMNVSITTVAALDGDQFTVNAAADASSNITVNSTIAADTDKIAAGLTSNNGDGANALDLAQLQNSLSLNKDTATSTGTASFAEYYNSIVGSVGVAANQANTSYNQQESINFELENRHEQVAGVSLDEEMLNLIKFQHAYQAAARMISTIDELLQTVVALGR